ncbi:MAG: T9SS type A sorting domain-containing protein [Saprospiraceae bacterium]|nr:T9SS type A sorting domain-containing protein [Saprospiraceae bacterium]
MKYFNSLVLFAAVLLFSTNAQAQERYLEPVFDDVNVTYDLTYGVNATVLLATIVGQAVPEELKFDFYEPADDDNTSRPLVLFFHTGNFLPSVLNQTTSGTRGDSINVEIAHRLAKMGYTVAICSYRLGWNPTAPTQPERALGLIQAAYRGVQDARTAIRYFKRTVAEQGNPFGVDPSRIVLWGEGTGGYITLATATLDRFQEIIFTTNPPGKFLTDLNGDGNPDPMVNPIANGDIYGTSYGVLPFAAPPLPAGDTLCYPNHVGYDSDFQLCVNMGGALGDISWLEEGEVPMISFHVPLDPNAPYDDAVLIVPTTGDPIVQVQGSFAVAEKANMLGNNDVFIGIDDEYTDAAIAASAVAGHPYLEGLYPFHRAVNGFGRREGSPWSWWDAAYWDAIPHPTGAGSYHFIGLLGNATMSAAQGRLYTDTIMGYFAPRAFVALNLASSTQELIKGDEVRLTAFPNPAGQELMLQSAPEYPMQDVLLFDMSGRQVQAHFGIGNNQYRISRGNLPKGVYVAKIRFEQGIKTHKIMFR